MIRGGLLLPVLLVSLGATILAVNLGYVDGDAVHGLIHVSWPVLLVLIGIEVAHARRQPYLALASELVVVAVAGVVLAVAQPVAVVPSMGEMLYGHGAMHHNSAPEAQR